jgi:hypothetical protein
MVIGLLATMSIIVAVPVHGAVVLAPNAFSDTPATCEGVACCVPQSDGYSSVATEARTEIGLCLSLECSKEDDSRRVEAIEILTHSELFPSGMSMPHQTVSQTTGVGATGLLSADRVDGLLPSPLIRYFSPESRALLPSGPSSRWFRPPRV